MRKAIPYIEANRVRISGFTVLTVDEAIHACELTAATEKEDAARAFCEAICAERCPEKTCAKYQVFIRRIGYTPVAEESKSIKQPPFEEQTLF